MSTDTLFDVGTAEGLTMTAAAEAIGVNRATLYRWKDRGMPVLENGRIDLEAVAAWKLEAEDRRKQKPAHETALMPEEPVTTTADPGNAEAVRWATMYRKARALREVHNLKVLQEEYIRRDEVRDLLVSRALEFRRALEGLQHRLPPVLGPADERECSRLLTLEFRRILEDYSRPDPLLEQDAVG